MKLQCQVELINRTHSSLNIKSHSKPTKSTLVIGKEPKCENEFFILYFSTVNKNGTKYRIKCIKQVFVKCINEGKATLRFEEPPHDLCIKSEVIQLKCFLRALKSCMTGDTKNLALSNLSVIPKDNAPTKLVIKDRSEFPVKGMPRTLEILHIVGLKLCNFRRDILLLRNLTILNLSNNEITKLPPELGRLPKLSELYLNNNHLGVGGQVDWQWLLAPEISKSLKLLELTGNSFRNLPNAMWKLQRLVTLKLDNNKLQVLPSTIGRISSLRYLTVSKNELEYLPCSLMQCQLEYIDVSSNNFYPQYSAQSSEGNKSNWDIYIQDLVNLSARVVLKTKQFYAPNIIPSTLCEFLDNAYICVCGTPVLNDVFCIKMEFDLKDFFKVVVFDTSKSSYAWFKCCICSPKCFMKKC